MHAWMSRLAGKGGGLTGFVVGVVATLTVVGGGVAIAAIPSTTTAKFNGCVSKDTGVLRLINYQAGKRCKKSEKSISWAQGWSYKGVWRAATSYRPGDVVLDNGSSYVARTASLAKSPPTDASRWGLLASPGPQGIPGQAGVADITYVQATQVVAQNEYLDKKILCPAEKHVVSGGVETVLHELTRSGPVDGDDLDPLPDDAWQVRARNIDTSQVTMTAWAVCMTARAVPSS
jgi:hypothetical protein